MPILYRELGSERAGDLPKDTQLGLWNSHTQYWRHMLSLLLGLWGSCCERRTNLCVPKLPL